MEDDITQDDAIKVICEDYKNNYKHTPFILENYLFNGLKINIEVKKHTNWDTLMLKFWIINYEKACDDDNEIMCLNDTENEHLFETIDDLISFLFDEFRNKYAYSKVLDEIHLKEKILIKEKLLKAHFMLCQNNLPDRCCVCMDYNKVLTACNHNVCRLCYNSLPYTKVTSLLYEFVGKKCPLCRELI